jgi:dihydropteroate synthase
LVQSTHSSPASRVNRPTPVSDIPLSIDTRHALVAQAAVDAGADIVNDISGGTWDPDMPQVVAAHSVPLILMHMRGTPETMQDMTNYDNVLQDVANSLQERSLAAQQAGVHRWQQVIDPGIGFSKDLRGNLQLLRHLQRFRELNLPVLLGTSRKGFLGKITGVQDAPHRDPATLASCIASLCLAEPGPTLVRVHNVEMTVQGLQVMDAIRK